MDPALGRFTTPDPVKDFVNPYSYVRNNPVNRMDPTAVGRVLHWLELGETRHKSEKYEIVAKIRYKGCSLLHYRRYP